MSESGSAAGQGAGTMASAAPSPTGSVGGGGGGRRRPPSGRAWLRGLWAALIAVLAVSAGILLVNLLHDPDDGHDEPAGRPPIAVTTAATASTPATASPSPTQAATSSAAPATSSAPATPSSRPPAPAGGGAAFAPVVILNNSKLEGLAADAQTQVEAAGFTVTRIGGWGGSINVARTTIFYESDDLLPAARTLQRLVPGIDEIRKVSADDLIRPDGEHDDLLLVVTKYYPNPSPKP